MRPWGKHFRREKKRTKERKFNSKNTASSVKHYYFLKYLVLFSKEPADEQKEGWKNWRSHYRCTWYTYHTKDALDNHEQTGGGACCKRPRQRGTYASFTCVLLWCRYLQSHPDGTTKKQISYIGDPQTGEVYSYQHQVKKQKKTIFCIRTSMPAEF